MKKIDIKISKLNNIATFIIAIGCLLSLLMIPLDIPVGRKIFYACGYLSIIGVLVKWIYIKHSFKKQDLLVASSLLLFGLVNILWVVIFKPAENYSPIYSVFMNIGKLLILSSFLYLFISDSKQKNNIIISAVIIISLVMDACVYYQHFKLGYIRADLGTEKATIAAYIISLISSLGLSAALEIKHKLKFYLSFLLFMMGFSAIILTQTRAAILFFPLISLFSIAINKNISKAAIMKAIGVFIVIIIAFGFIFKDKLTSRYHDITNDWSQYQKSNSDTSIGARFAMAIVGLKSGIDSPLGQSAEDRAERVMKIVTLDQTLFGANQYVNIHLHNEVIDNFSLKGILGVALLLFIYISIIYKSIRPELNILALGIIFNTIVYGISDVLFFSKEFTATFILCLVISILINNSKDNIVNHEKE
ncbi:O-antigen ligase domain-containing protein [Limnobaculum zhutongyuii]|uniref:O-antigen ligase domain-containing protein n=1 Tax=Limnobaculum zhutongyuii TaxID=2498113 RepID=A0A411WQA4_9GAMM|nr:O-antigen ligase family protein [Limnobaculum zhutongyuii]QBH98372.1 O-antigen ligase domain-containing protein [Limnobaculum zhutongyuii]TQS89731.1 O-antigen ligase domain-containing protein [Limnobaculum zhutongyuii]